MNGKYNKKFFEQLSEQLEELFPKGEKCERGKKLPCRSKAILFNAYANLYLKELLTEMKTKGRREKLKKAI